MRGLVPYAWRHLVARPARTLLTAFGIAIGVAVLVATLAVNAGLEASIDRQVVCPDRSRGHPRRRLHRDRAHRSDAGRRRGRPRRRPRCPGHRATDVPRRGPGRLPTTQPVTVLGVDLPRERRVRDLAIARGNPPDTLGPTDALITERLAASDGLDVGSEITVLGAGAPVKATVAGILAGDGPAPAAGGRTVVLGLQAASALNRPDGTDPATDGAIARPVADRRRARRGRRPGVHDRRARAGADRRALRALDARGRRRVAGCRHRGHPLDDGAARGDQPVRGGVRDPQHARDDRRGARPRARPAARRGRAAGAGRRGGGRAGAPARDARLGDGPRRRRRARAARRRLAPHLRRRGHRRPRDHRPDARRRPGRGPRDHPRRRDGAGPPGRLDQPRGGACAPAPTARPRSGPMPAG